MDENELRRVLRMIAERDREMGDGAAVLELLKRGYVSYVQVGWVSSGTSSEDVGITESGTVWLDQQEA